MQIAPNLLKHLIEKNFAGIRFLIKNLNVLLYPNLIFWLCLLEPNHEMDFTWYMDAAVVTSQALSLLQIKWLSEEEKKSGYS